MKAVTKGFMDLNPQECESTYIEVIKNADTHHRVAAILAEAKEYSNGISHLILATEEYIKALVLFLDSKEFEIRKTEGVKKLFYMHGPRHNLLKEIFTVWLVIKPFLEKELKGEQKTYRNKFLNFLNGTVNVLTLLLSGIHGFVNYRWWEEADRLKQNGFYVDYKDLPVLPNQLGPDEYTTASQNARLIYTDINKLIEFIKSMSQLELEQFKLIFEDSQMKKMISESIRRKN